MDYKKVLRLHFVNHLSCREIAESCGDCSKSTVNEFLKRFRENPELSYPLSADITNEYIESMLYKKPGVSADRLLYREFNKEAVYKALARKGETLKHLWQKYNAIGVVDGKKPMSYRQYCRCYSEWADSKQLTFHIQRYPGVNLELDYAGKQLYLHNRRNPEETTKVTIFIAALTYSDYFYAEGMTECDIRNWIRVNNNALAYFGGVTPTITPDNCKVAVARNKDWVSPVLNKDFQAWAEHNNTVLTPAKVKYLLGILSLDFSRLFLCPFQKSPHFFHLFSQKYLTNGSKNVALRALIKKGYPARHRRLYSFEMEAFLCYPFTHQIHIPIIRTSLFLIF